MFPKIQLQDKGRTLHPQVGVGVEFGENVFEQGGVEGSHAFCGGLFVE